VNNQLKSVWINENPDAVWQTGDWYDLHFTVAPPLLQLWRNGMILLDNHATLPSPPDPLRSAHFSVAPGVEVAIERVVIAPPERLGMVIPGHMTCGDCGGEALRTDIPSDALLEAVAETKLAPGTPVLVATNRHVIEAVPLFGDAGMDLDPLQPILRLREREPATLGLYGNPNLNTFLQVKEGAPIVVILPAT